MIITKFYKKREDGIDLYRTFSNQGYCVRCDQDGTVYDEVVNVQNSGYTFTETDIPVADEISDAEALDILTGRDADEPQDSAQTP